MKDNEGRWQRLRGWLLKRADNHRENLQLVIIGACVFFTGAGILVWAEHLLPPSLEQEMAALAGLLLLVCGAAIALLGYLGLSLLRLLKFFSDHD